LNTKSGAAGDKETRRQGDREQVKLLNENKFICQNPYLNAIARAS
jgi:hypothetical protein